MAKSLLASLAVLVCLFAVYFIWKPTTYTSTTSGTPSGAVQAFQATKFDEVTKIEIQKGKGSVVLEKDASQPAGWVVASSHRYPADKDKVEKILKSLREIEKIEQRGSSEAAHASYEVDAKKGAVVILHGKDKELGRLVVGKSAPGGGISSNLVFARFGDDKKTYSIESGIRNEASLWSENAEGKNYLLKDLLKLGEDMVIESVRIARPDKPDILVEHRTREVLVEKPKDDAATAAAADGEAAKADEEKKAEEKKEEKKTEDFYAVTSGTDTFEVGKSEEWTAKGLLNRAKTISIDDAAEPKDLAEYGLDKPQLRATVNYRKTGAPDTELKTFSVAFGNAKKNEKGDTQGYYFILENDEATKGRIYVIQEYKLNEWNKEVKDFQPKPKEPEKPKDAPPAEPPVPAQPGAEAAPPPAQPAPGASTTPEAAPATEPQGSSPPPSETRPATPPAESAPPPGGTATPPPADPASPGGKK